MKISRDGVVPQLEPTGRGRRLLIRLGGAKRILQQSSFPMQAVTMVNASISAWATSQTLRSVFGGSFALFAGSVTTLLLVWLLVYFSVLLPGEQAWGQGQSQRTERSPLKRDTEAIRDRLDDLEAHLETEPVVRSDGGDASDGA